MTSIFAFRPSSKSSCGVSSHRSSSWSGVHVVFDLNYVEWCLCDVWDYFYTICYVEFEISLMEEFDCVYISYGLCLYMWLCENCDLWIILSIICKMQGFWKKQNKTWQYGHFAVSRHTAKACAVRVHTAKSTRGAHLCSWHVADDHMVIMPCVFMCGARHRPEAGMIDTASLPCVAAQTHGKVKRAATGDAR